MSWKQTVNKPADKPAAPKPKFDTKDDDWDTDLSYENSGTEKSQRYGSASIPGSGRVDHVDFDSIQAKMKTVDRTVKEDFKERNPTLGYGGKYGTEQVMDKAAEGYAYKADVAKHSSQTDGKKGFGGVHGIDERPKDQSAVGFDYKPTAEKHSSQTDYTASLTVEKEEPKEAPVEPVASPPPPPPKPSAEPKVAEKPASSTPIKAGIGNIRARFENMKKEQEAEAAKRVAEERKKRTTTDQKLQQQEAAKETTREPSPVRPATPPQPEPSTEETSETVDNTDTKPAAPVSHHDDNYTEKKTDVPARNEETNQRKPSSTSSKNDNSEDEWADN